MFVVNVKVDAVVVTENAMSLEDGLGHALMSQIYKRKNWFFQ